MDKLEIEGFVVSKKKMLKDLDRVLGKLQNGEVHGLEVLVDRLEPPGVTINFNGPSYRPELAKSMDGKRKKD